MFVVVVIAGCAPKARKQPGACFPPTEPLAAVVAQINANNQLIPTLWSRHEFEAWIRDEKQKVHYVNGEGVLLYRRPRELLFRGTKDIAGRVFEIGSTAERYWLIVEPELDTIWWGQYGDRAAATDLPIPPDLFIEVLGVGVIVPDLLQTPVPVLRFNNDACAYMITWHARGEDRWYATKEIWYDHAAKLPVKVLLYDPNGRVLLRANLGNHRPVRTEGVPQAQWPKVATDCRLFFPETQSSMAIRLEEPRLEYRGVPREGTIQFPADPGVSRQVRLGQEAQP